MCLVFQLIKRFESDFVKIQNISSLYNPFNAKIQDRRPSNLFSLPKFNTGHLSADVVSFRAKDYSIDSIINPTGHCAYCGCKVYTEAQIEGLAKTMLGQKSHRLQGSIRSVLEKLDSAMRSEELAFAKKIENAEEIDFFKRFLRIASEKTHLDGEEIFKEVDGIESDGALELLKNNMKPLTRTIDHVSPQNLDEENNNVDSNLVEACYCCNHDLKKGVTFPEFYAMFPSIKENMPPEKFDYAYNNLMSSASGSAILNRMSASNLLKYIQRLIGQRNDEIDKVKSTEFRIMEASTNISSSIETCEAEIVEKQVRKQEAVEKLEALSSDEEYNAIVKRLQLVQQSKQADAVLSSLRESRKSASDSLNEIKNPSKKQSKQSKQINMSKEEKEAKIASLKKTLETLSQKISEKQEEKDNIDLSVMELDEKFPTVEILQGRKNRAEQLVNAHVALIKEKENLARQTEARDRLDFEMGKLKSQIARYPQEDFDILKYSEEEQEQYKRYQLCLEALAHINTHSTGGGVKAAINIASKPFFEQEIAELEKMPIVKASIAFSEKKELQAKLDSLEKQNINVVNSINASTKQIMMLQKRTAEKTHQEAILESQNISAHIRRLNEKQSYLELPKVINSLTAEISLLSQTINDLSQKQAEIQNLKKIQS